MVFESGVVPQNWRTAVIVKQHKSKGEKNKYKRYKDISLLSLLGKIYEGLLMNRVRRMTEGLTDDEQGGFRSRRGLCRPKNLQTKENKRKREGGMCV